MFTETSGGITRPSSTTHFHQDSEGTHPVSSRKIRRVLESLSPKMTSGCWILVPWSRTTSLLFLIRDSFLPVNHLNQVGKREGHKPKTPTSLIRLDQRRGFLEPDFPTDNHPQVTPSVYYFPYHSPKSLPTPVYPLPSLGGRLFPVRS